MPQPPSGWAWPPASDPLALVFPRSPSEGDSPGRLERRHVELAGPQTPLAPRYPHVKGAGRRGALARPRGRGPSQGVRGVVPTGRVPREGSMRRPCGAWDSCCPGLARPGGKALDGLHAGLCVLRAGPPRCLEDR